MPIADCHGLSCYTVKDCFITHQPHSPLHVNMQRYEFAGYIQINHTIPVADQYRLILTNCEKDHVDVVGEVVVCSCECVKSG